MNALSILFVLAIIATIATIAVFIIILTKKENKNINQQGLNVPVPTMQDSPITFNSPVTPVMDRVVEETPIVEPHPLNAFDTQPTVETNDTNTIN